MRTLHSDAVPGLHHAIPNAAKGLEGGSRTQQLEHELAAAQPGLNLITIHPVIDAPEIREIIPDWRSRYEEYLFFMRPEARDLLKKLDNAPIGWRDVPRIFGQTA